MESPVSPASNRGEASTATVEGRTTITGQWFRRICLQRFPEDHE